MDSLWDCTPSVGPRDITRLLKIHHRPRKFLVVSNIRHTSTTRDCLDGEDPSHATQSIGDLAKLEVGCPRTPLVDGGVDDRAEHDFGRRRIVIEANLPTGPGIGFEAAQCTSFACVLVRAGFFEWEGSVEEEIDGSVDDVAVNDGLTFEDGVSDIVSRPIALVFEGYDAAFFKVGQKLVVEWRRGTCEWV